MLSKKQELKNMKGWLQHNQRLQLDSEVMLESTQRRIRCLKKEEEELKSCIGRLQNV